MTIQQKIVKNDTILVAFKGETDHALWFVESIECKGESYSSVSEVAKAHGCENITSLEAKHLTVKVKPLSIDGKPVGNDLTGIYLFGGEWCMYGDASPIDIYVRPDVVEPS